jgi:ssDNA-specific exonuclease RecJ
MMCITNKTTMQNEGCRIYLVNTITKTRYIGAENEIRIAKETILNARNYEIMYPIKRFNIEISEDQLKQAFDRAKEFLEKSKKPLFDDTTATIGEAYVRVVEYALQCAKAEADSEDIIQEKRKFIYNKKEKTIMIYTGIFNDMLKHLDLNYTQKIFNRKLKMLETDMGVQLIYTNRSEGKGYGWNTTGNVRYYKYALNEELLGGDEK